MDKSVEDMTLLKYGFSLLDSIQLPFQLQDLPQIQAHHRLSVENTDLHGKISCTSLCCGCGYISVKKLKKDRCYCKFQWCCTVSSETCLKTEWITVCQTVWSESFKHWCIEILLVLKRHPVSEWFKRFTEKKCK
nr:PREDICTED: protein Wnt-10a-like [Bemisia tabaci]